MKNAAIAAAIVAASAVVVASSSSCRLYEERDTQLRFDPNGVAPLQTFAEGCLSLNVVTTPFASGPAWSFRAAADDEFGGEGEVDRSGVTVSEQVE